MKRILFVTTDPQASLGISYVTRELLKRLNPLKWEKIVMSRCGLPLLPRNLGFCKSFSFVDAYTMPWMVNELQPDIVVVYGPSRTVGTFAEHMPKRVIKKLRAKIIAYYTFEMTPPTILASPEAVEFYDKYMFPSQWCIDEFKKYVSGKPIYRVPHGVDMDLFEPNIRIHDSNPFYYGFVGRMWGRKQLNRYLPALNRVVYRHGHGDRARGMMLSSGQPEEMARARLMIQRYRLEKHMKWDGPYRHNVPVPQEVMPDYYHQMNCMVHPTGGEAWGLPLSEAQATGTPVITTDLPVCREVCGDAALYVKVADTHPSWEGDLPLIDMKDLERQMQELIVDEDLYYKLAKAGIDHARTITWDKAVDALEYALEDEKLG